MNINCVKIHDVNNIFRRGLVISLIKTKRSLFYFHSRFHGTPIRFYSYITISSSYVNSAISACLYALGIIVEYNMGAPKFF